MPAYLQLVQREARDVQRRFGPLLAGRTGTILGVYQTHEMIVSGSTFWRQEYRFYDQIAEILHSSLGPDYQVVVSPYWDVNKDSANLTSRQTMDGIAALARTGIDVVAPQEGRGTGKCACFTEEEANVPIFEVDPNLARYPNVRGGNLTFREQFWASTSELFAAARATVNAANAHNRSAARQLALWFNLEAFEHTRENPHCGAADTDRTNASRVERSWQLVRDAPLAPGTQPPVVDALITYMWDPFFTCTPEGYRESLYQALLPPPPHT